MALINPLTGVMAGTGAAPSKRGSSRAPKPSPSLVPKVAAIVEKRHAALTAESQAQGAEFDRWTQAMKGSATAQAPALDPIEPMPANHIAPKEFSGFTGTVVALAALASLSSREPLTAALNALSAGVRGYAQGNLEAGKREMARWSAETQRAIALNKQQLEAYQGVLENNRLSIAKKMAEIKIKALEFRDHMTLQSIESRDLSTWVTAMDARATLGSHLQLWGLKLSAGPKDVQAFKYYDSLDPAKQASFLTYLRAMHPSMATAIAEYAQRGAWQAAHPQEPYPGNTQAPGAHTYSTPDLSSQLP